MTESFRKPLEAHEVWDFINALLNWLSHKRHQHFYLLYSGDGHERSPGPHSYKLLCGISEHGNKCVHFKDVDEFVANRFCFGVLSYDLKNEIEQLHSLNEAYYDTLDHLLLVPEILIRIDHTGALSISGDDHDVINDTYLEIVGRPHSGLQQKVAQRAVVFESDVSDTEYLERVARIKSEIIEGNVYELNYCRNYYAKARINPFELFKLFTQKNPTPYSALVKSGDQFVISGSMERFLCKSKGRLISQPIKGTAHNSGMNNTAEKERLLSSEKEKAENLMIVDLVRNDLSKSSVTGSVKVDELFGVYSYPNVHQMISTVSSQVKPDTPFSQVIRDAFPMGSMTGTPKLSAMQLIEELEQFKRGIYSGSIGYIDENGDFDWNVVIRTVIYNDETNTISVPVGSAITYDSIDTEELNECGVKVEKIMKLIEESVVA